jgi:hypothetical protein
MWLPSFYPIRRGHHDRKQRPLFWHHQVRTRARDQGAGSLHSSQYRASAPSLSLENVNDPFNGFFTTMSDIAEQQGFGQRLCATLLSTTCRRH